MEPKTQTLINPGDGIVNSQSLSVPIASVEKGMHGLLIKGTFGSGYDYQAYAPYELPPVDEVMWNWYGWGSRDWLTSVSGLKLGVVALQRLDPRDTIEEFDAEWERTEEEMRRECS